MITALLWVLLLAPAQAEEPEVKTSLALLTDEEAWASPGFRVALGYGVENVFARGDVPSGVVHSATLRLGARLDGDWSLIGALRYGVLTGGENPGLRFAGTIEPTIHFTESLSLSLGVGAGGFVVTNTGAPTPEPESGIVASYTLPDSDPLLRSCQGIGVVALARLEYAWILSELAATGPALELDAQWTGCTQQLGRADPDTGESIVLRQYWEHYGVRLGWAFTFR